MATLGQCSGLLSMGRGSGGARLLQLLFLPLFVAQQEKQHTVPVEQRSLCPPPAETTSSVECLNSYGFGSCRVDCVWHPPRSLEEAQLYLNFSQIYDAGSVFLCVLSAAPEAQGTYRCSAECQEGQFTENDRYHVTLHGLQEKPRLCTVFTGYEPKKHIACDPPVDLQSNMSGSKCRIRWKKPPAYDFIYLGDWQWELAFKALQAPWEEAQNKTFVSKEAWVDIDGSELNPGANYTGRLRCKTPDHVKRYRSHWSPWSAATTWRTPLADRQKPLDSPPLRGILLALPFCLGALILSLRVFWRVKASCGAGIPSPASFFQPLYLSHNGDFKDWAGLTRKGGWLASGGEDHGSTVGSSKGEERNGALAVTHAGPQPLPEESPASLYVVAKAIAPEHVQKGIWSGCSRGEPPLLLPWESALQVEGQGDGGQKGSSLQWRTGLQLPQQGCHWEAKRLFSCSSSNGYYMWASDSQSRPASMARAKTLQSIWPGSPDSTDMSCGTQL